jgi:UDP-glucose 4-epimerase
MWTALVTGGAGFIGSHLVEELLAVGWRVRVLDNLATGSLSDQGWDTSTVEFLNEDLRDLRACRHACHGVSVVFHQGALPSVPRSIADPLTSHAVNVDGTLNLLVAARDEGARRFVFASSSSVYGNSVVSPKSEEMPPSPLSPYAVQKLVGEQYCRVFHALYGLETVALRYFNVFGPRQRADSAYAAVIPRFLAAALRDEPVTIHGDGKHSRDFTYVANVVKANLLAAEAPGVGGSVFNVGCGESHTLLELCRGIEEISGRRLHACYGPPRPGDVCHSRADITRARAALGYHPEVGFLEGLARTAASSFSLPVPV